MNIAQRWQQWFEAGWVQDAGAPEPATQPAPNPWYIRLILGVCGWIGGLLLLVFIGFSWFSVMRESGIGVAGLVLLAAAYGIYRMAKSELGDQFALALSLAGQGAVAFALFTASDAWSMVVALFAIGGLQLILLWLMPNALHRTLSMFFAVIALHLAFVLRGYPSPLPAAAVWLAAMLWLDESRWQFRLGERFLPVAVGATFAGLLVMAPLNVGELGLHYYMSADDLPSLPRWIYLAGAIATSLVWLWAGWRWAGAAPRLRLSAMSLAVLMAVAGWWMPGMSFGLLVLLLGFARGRPALMGLGVAGGLVHLSWFYYSLEATLLVKSASLVVLGAVLLIACRALPLVWKEARDV